MSRCHRCNKLIDEWETEQHGGEYGCFECLRKDEMEPDHISVSRLKEAVVLMKVKQGQR